MNQNYLLPLVLYIFGNKPLPEVAITAKVISQFTGHNVIFHYDNTYKEKVDSIITESDIKVSYLTANYDVQQSSTFTRPIGYKFLHIILLENYTRFDVFTNTKNNSIQHVDVLFFVTKFSKDKKSTTGEANAFMFWDGNVLHKAGALFIFDIGNLSLYTVCFFCGKLTKTLQKIDDLSMDNDHRDVVIPQLHVYINKFRNFHKHVFYVGYNIYKPLFFGRDVEKPGNHTVFDGRGIERELLVTLHNKLNMSCVLIPYSNRKNSWAAVVNAVSRNILDWAIAGITISLPRTQIVDFTTEIRSEPYSILYSIYDDPWLSWRNILLPFQLYIWITLAATVIVISFLLFIAVKSDKTQNDATISIAYFIQSWLRLLFEQSVPIMHDSVKSRWTTVGLMCLWFALALIMNYSYKSKLTASLINSRAKEYDTIDELVDRNYFFQMNDFDSTVLQQNLRLSNDPKFLETLRRSDNNSAYCTSVLKTIGQKVAMIDEATLMQNMVQENCRQLMTIQQHDDLRLITDDLFPSSHAWPMQLNTPYRVAFNHLILRFQAAGLFVKWNGDYSNSRHMVSKSHQGQKTTYVPKFNLTSLLGPAIIWILGMCIATLIFIVELIRRRR